MRHYLLLIIGLLICISASAQEDETCQSQIAFSSDMSGDSDIYMIELPDDGELAQEATQLTETHGADVYPRWSPDGTMIAYQNGDFDVVIMDAEGNHIQTLEHPETGELAPTWSPKNNAVAYISSDGRDVVLGIEMLWLRDDIERPEGMPTTFHMAIDDVRKHLPDWSPIIEDGFNNTQFVFEADYNGNTDIFLYHVELPAHENLTNTPYDETSPAWSPDGTQIAFSSLATDAMEIWLMDIETQEVTQLTDFGQVAVSPQWSPDGLSIVFSGRSIFDESEDFDLYIMGADGNHVRQITDFEGNEGFPDWRPCASDNEPD